MTHEPECPWRFEDDCHVVAAGVTFCEVARAAYQRGREDAAEAVEYEWCRPMSRDAYDFHDWKTATISAARGDGEQA